MDGDGHKAVVNTRAVWMGDGARDGVETSRRIQKIETKGQRMMMRETERRRNCENG